MSMYLQNLDLLRLKAPTFYQRLIADEYHHHLLHVLDAGDGRAILQLGDRRCYLHRADDTESEMQQLFAPADAENEEQTLVIFGLGMGHCLDYLARHRWKYRQVHVIEPFDNIFKFMLSRRELSALLNMHNVAIHVIREPKEISDLIWGQITSFANLKLLYHLSYCGIFTELYQELGAPLREPRKRI